MHAYEPFRQPYPTPIPSMRPARDTRAGHSTTPIYDALCSEYRRAFRALPGDRSGEEDLGFKGFGPLGMASEAAPGMAAGAGWRPYPGGRLATLPPAPRRGV
ncbi:hypothetical protein QCN29_29580 [Streptomyces sp. HNM0663]|uniref:Uncharacterized protein n=1 Tax=Streptomyces chengmaiensis TaxID=3040919 RepID=A0ABT6HWT3_9ACTN|nr:hypothetical protein [Streptomyces chengmaiensis]MDH2392860.1 hypothetical protein [Streptomyces chengmaiensis]